MDHSLFSKKTFWTFAVALLLLGGLFFLFHAGFLDRGAKTRVLFLGNSLTSTNHLPAMIKDLAKARRHRLKYEFYTPGGWTLAQHALDPRALEEIKKGNWDFVVLQEQSQMPAILESELQTYVYPFAVQLSRLIRTANPKTKIAFYMTMAKQKGDPENVAHNPEVATYEGMQKRIGAAYEHMAEENQGLLIPVGQIWARAHHQDPSMGLWTDGTHPTLAGTYLAACVFYAILFKDTPVGLPHPEGVPAEAADFLQKIVFEGLFNRESGIQ